MESRSDSDNDEHNEPSGRRGRRDRRRRYHPNDVYLGEDDVSDTDIDDDSSSSDDSDAATGQSTGLYQERREQYASSFVEHDSEKYPASSSRQNNSFKEITYPVVNVFARAITNTPSQACRALYSNNPTATTPLPNTSHTNSIENGRIPQAVRLNSAQHTTNNTMNIGRAPSLRQPVSVRHNDTYTSRALDSYMFSTTYTRSPPPLCKQEHAFYPSTYIYPAKHPSSTAKPQSTATTSGSVLIVYPEQMDSVYTRDSLVPNIPPELRFYQEPNTKTTSILIQPAANITPPHTTIEHSHTSTILHYQNAVGHRCTG